MNKRRLGITALGIVVVVAGVGIAVAQLAPPADRLRAVAEPSGLPTAPPTRTGNGTPTPTASSPTAPGETAAPAPAESPPAGTEGDAGTGTGTDAAPRTSTEVLPGEPEAVTLPPSTPHTALVSLPLPPSASSVGAVVSGFPTEVLPGIPASLVENSSVATQGDRMQAALEARTTLPTEDVLAFYRQHFAPLGLLESPTAASKRSTTLSFSRGDDSVTLAVTAVAGGSSYILFGAFTAAD